MNACQTLKTTVNHLPAVQRGAASVEYTVVTLMVIVALFIPLKGEGSLSGVGLLLQGLRNFQMHSTFLLSLP